MIATYDILQMGQEINGSVPYKVQHDKEKLNTYADKVIRHQTFIKINELPNCQFAAHCVADLFLFF